MDLKKLSSHSKVWVYQADRFFSEDEKMTISEILHDFVTGWDSHGNQLQSAFEIKYDRFIILAVDEKAYMASGCSIDKSVAVIKQIEKLFQVTLLDRTQIAFQNNHTISSVKFSDVKKKIQEGELKPDSIIFNNLVSTISELENNWEVPAKSSWLSKFFDN